jgi:hypothetical protein
LKILVNYLSLSLSLDKNKTTPKKNSGLSECKNVWRFW